MSTLVKDKKILLNRIDFLNDSLDKTNDIWLIKNKLILTNAHGIGPTRLATNKLNVNVKTFVSNWFAANTPTCDRPFPCVALVLDCLWSFMLWSLWEAVDDADKDDDEEDVNIQDKSNVN